MAIILTFGSKQLKRSFINYCESYKLDFGLLVKVQSHFTEQKIPDFLQVIFAEL